jgi:hypothetical protein
MVTGKGARERLVGRGWRAAMKQARLLTLRKNGLVLTPTH